MQPDNQSPEDAQAEILGIFLEALHTPRYGWKRTFIPQGLYEYVIQRQAVNDAIRLVQKVDWQNIGCDRELAEKIRGNALHALATLAQAMRRAEQDHIT